MLATSQDLFKADLYTITLRSGVVLYYTEASNDITINGHTYLAAQIGNGIPGLTRSSVRMAIGLADEPMQVNILYDATSLIGGLTPGAFANAGGFDRATIVVDKFLTPSLGDVSRGTINLFNGVVMDVEANSTRVTLQCATSLMYLNAAFPRNYFLPQCNHALFDAGCTLNKTSWVQANKAVSSSTRTVVTCSTLTQAADYFRLGYIVVKTGVNAGLVRSVKSFASGALTLLYPLPVACGVGDLIDAYPGCDKTNGANGCAKFSNEIHWRAYPDVPTPELIAMGSAGSGTAAPIDNSGAGAGGGDVGTGPGGVGLVQV
jgi:uncharacterized phage protein (TIGR02218 family)